MDGVVTAQAGEGVVWRTVCKGVVTCQVSIAIVGRDPDGHWVPLVDWCDLAHTNGFYKYVKKAAMRIAVLETNTDASAFALAQPRDGEVWRNLLAGQRADWEFSLFDVTQGDFPPEQSRFDGWIIGGSPASVHDGAVWIDRLTALIRRIVGRQERVFGACFGHQVIAQALGGTVGDNPDGWKLGIAAMTGAHGTLRQYAAHAEQVTTLPAGAQILAASDHCPVASFAMGEHVLTTQYHPEMTHRFIAELVEHLAHDLPAGVIAQARADLRGVADTAASVDQIVAFFESQARAASKSMAVT
jgi:GMP synthase-like glutamine amidotransferase